MSEGLSGSASPEPVLVVDDLTVAYRSGTSRRLALDRVSMAVGDAEILGVVGESGCGKSTLGMTILRLLPANGRIASGSISMRGYGDLGQLSGEEMRSVRGREIATIFQDPTTSLNPRVSIGTQLMQVQRAHAAERDGGSATRRSFKENALAKLSEVGLPNPARAFDRYSHEFSGGMRQRVMIAMALLFEPKLIIADEATSALDVTLEAQILELLMRLREAHGTSMLFISHDLGVVSQLCDRVAVMYAGRVVEELPGTDVLAAPRHPYTQALHAAVPNRRTRGRRLIAIGGRVPDLSSPAEACSFAPRCIDAQDVCRTVAPELYPFGAGSVRCLAYSASTSELWPTPPSTEDWRRRGDSVSALRPAAAEPPSEPLLDLREVEVHFGLARQGLFGKAKPPVRAVDGVSLTLERGHILGIVGESGSGKTTLGETVVRLLSPTGGRILFAGEDVTRMSARKTLAFRRRAQMIFQNPYSSLSPRMQVGAQLIEPYEIHHVAKSARRHVDELLSAVDLPPTLRSAYPGQLSGGQARRVGIARALVLEPDLVVADEPTAGLDASAAAGTMNLLTDLRERMGLTVVLISHNLSLVTTSANEVCVMYFGEIVERGSTATVMATPAHPYTKALLELAPDPERASRLVRRRLLVPGEIPSADAPPTGCRFHPRCMYAQDICREVTPVLASLEAPPDGGSASSDGSDGAGSAGSDGGSRQAGAIVHEAACHFAKEVLAGVLSATSGATPAALDPAAAP